MVDWILDQERLGQPSTIGRVRELANLIDRHSGREGGVGQNWITRFKHRHSEIHIKIGRKIDKIRFDQPSSEVIKLWFSRLKHLMKDFQIRPCNTWNMDESGLGMRCTINERVLGTLKTTRIY